MLGFGFPDLFPFDWYPETSINVKITEKKLGPGGNHGRRACRIERQSLRLLAATSIAIFTFMRSFVSEVRERRDQRRAISSNVGRGWRGDVLVRIRVILLLLLLAWRSGGDAERATFFRRGDRFWLLGYTLLFLDPCLVLFIGLLAVGFVWFALWLVYLLFMIRYFPRHQTAW